MTAVYVVIGSQAHHFSNPAFARTFEFAKLDEVVPTGAVIGSGESPGGGGDIWAHAWSDSRMHPFKVFDPTKPPYNAYSIPKCFHVRNQAMVDWAKSNAGQVLAFWAGNTVHSGTLSTINRAKRAGVPYRVWKIGLNSGTEVFL